MIEIKEMNTDEFLPIFQPLVAKIFEAQFPIAHLNDLISEEEKSNIENLREQLDAKPQRINLVAYFNGELAGWSWGQQKTPTKFYMHNSAVLPAFRRKGIYRMLLQEMKKKALADGFQEIFSNHLTTNNAVIIPKLQEGFVTTGMEMTDLFGLTVRLSYFPNEKRRKLLNYRTSMIKSDNEIQSFFR